MDKFFTQRSCDRCGGNLDEGRIMSMYSEVYICMACKAKEQSRTDYALARDTEAEQVKYGNYNYKGIGLKD